MSNFLMLTSKLSRWGICVVSITLLISLWGIVFLSTLIHGIANDSFLIDNAGHALSGVVLLLIAFVIFSISSIIAFIGIIKANHRSLIPWLCTVSFSLFSNFIWLLMLLMNCDGNNITFNIILLVLNVLILVMHFLMWSIIFKLFIFLKLSYEKDKAVADLKCITSESIEFTADICAFNDIRC